MLCEASQHFPYRLEKNYQQPLTFTRHVITKGLLYGEWQTDPWSPPPAADGKVPKNDHGNYELWDGDLKLLPKGTTWLKMPKVSGRGAAHIYYSVHQNLSKHLVFFKVYWQAASGVRLLPSAP